MTWATPRRVNPSNPETIKKLKKVHVALSRPRVLTHRPLFIPLKKFRKPQKCIPKKFCRIKKGLPVLRRWFDCVGALLIAL